MSEIGAPPSLRTDEAAVHGFRGHAASIGAFPALFTAERNGTDCNPGEAVFLVYLLISNDGALYVGNLDAAKELMQPGSGLSGGRSFGVSGLTQAPVTSRLLASYASEHKRSETMALFNHMADLLGF